MNYLLNRPNYPFNDVKVPEGLEQLLSDISREVLRAQPETNNIYDFIATYLEKMLTTRETIEGIEALLTGIINKAADIAQDLRNDGLECNKAEAAAEVVRCFFQKFVDEKRKEKYAHLEFEFKEIDVILELMNKCKLSQIEVLRSQRVIFDAYQKFLTNYLKTLEGAILPPDMLDCVMQLTIDRYVADIPSFAVLNKAATTIKGDFNYFITRASKIHKHHQSVLGSAKETSDLYNEVVLLIVTYWNTTTQEQMRLVRPGGPSILNNLVKSVNERNLTDFLMFSTSSRSRLTVEDLAAIKIQRNFRRYRLRITDEKDFSPLKPTLAISNLIVFSKKNRSTTPDDSSIDDE